jgi:hypothetical protein
VATRRSAACSSASRRSSSRAWVFAIAVATSSVNSFRRISASGGSETRESPPADTTPHTRPSTTTGAPTPDCTPDARAASPIAPLTPA